MEVTRYDVKDFTDRYSEVWGVHSESGSNIYTVALNKQGAWSCGCPRWTRNKSRPECKHIRHIKELRKDGSASRIGLMNTPMPEQVKKNLSTFAAIEV